MKTARVLRYLGFEDLGIWAATLAGKIEQWLVGHSAELSAAGFDPRAIRSDAACFGPRLVKRADRVLCAWLEGLN